MGRKRQGSSGAGGSRAAEARNTAPGSRIHEGLIGERALVGTPYLADPGLRAEYEREIAPRTVASLSKILREIFPADARGTHPPASRPLRILDLGAGTGAVRAALRGHFGPGQTVVEVDRVATTPTTRIADITDTGALGTWGRSFDLVVAAHVLNELFLGETSVRRVDRLGKLVRRWSEDLLGEDGTLILIEPALRETSRVLLAVRDHVLAAGLHVAAPCFFSGPCPALVQERDWCHDSANADSGRRIDFSYLVVRSAGEASVDVNQFRIVSDPLPEKGRLRLFACGVAGRQPVVRLDRNRSDGNGDLDRLARGDVARISRTTFATDGLRIDAATTVERAPVPAWNAGARRA